MTPSALSGSSYRRHGYYRTSSAREADSRNLSICKSALTKLEKTDKDTVIRMAKDLSNEVDGLGPESVLRLLGSLGRFFAQNPLYLEARLHGKVIPRR